jgi:hypothetical protein
MRRKFLAVSFVIAVATLAYGGAPATDLRLVVFGRPPLAAMPSPLNANTDSVVVFMDEQPRVAVELVVVPDDGIPAATLERWWRKLGVEISDKNGVVRTVAGSDAPLLEARVRGELISGERSTYARWSARPTFVRLAIPVLPPGDYTARATLVMPSGATLRSDATVFHVRRGDEDTDVRRLYLRGRADKVSTFAEYKALMLELRALEPDNAGIIENIADHSLNNASPEETLAWYRQAQAMRKKASEKFMTERGDRLTAAERRSIEQQLLGVSLFEKVYSDYKAHQSDRRLVILGAGLEKKYAWFAKDGAMIGVIDLRNPSSVRPIDVRDRRP